VIGCPRRDVAIQPKGGKVVTIQLAPRTARAIDLAVGERCEGPIFLAADGRRLDRHGAARACGSASALCAACVTEGLAGPAARTTSVAVVERHGRVHYV
jgi:hypothetical protein